MENENRENQSGQVRKNPTRDNKNINQGQANEKSFSNQDASGKQFDRDEIDLDRSGVPGSQSGAQKQAGSSNQQAESQDLQGSQESKNLGQRGQSQDDSQLQ